MSMCSRLGETHGVKCAPSNVIILVDAQSNVRVTIMIMIMTVIVIMIFR